MRKLYFSILAGVIFMVIIISGCATTPPKPIYLKKVLFDLTDSSQAIQTQQNITIELKPMNIVQEHLKSRYVQPFKITYIPFLSEKSVIKNVPLNVPFYHDLLPFRVTIINNTDHILRMKDSRVAYIDPSSDEPVMALDKAILYEDMEVLPAYNIIKNRLIKEYTPLNDIDESIERSLKKIIKKIKFINAFNKEIMPGMRYTGVIVFPISPTEAGEGKVSFIDMVSETDQAGNIKRKVRFDYRVKPIYKYYKYDPATGREVEISESVIKEAGAAYDTKGHTVNFFPEKTTEKMVRQALDKGGKPIDVWTFNDNIPTTKILFYKRRDLINPLLFTYDTQKDLFTFQAMWAWEKNKFDQIKNTVEYKRSAKEWYSNELIRRSADYAKKGDIDSQYKCIKKLESVQPINATVYNTIAWFYATNETYRDGEKAIEFGEKSVSIMKVSGHLDTLAAAYAEAGNFEKAIELQEKAIRLSSNEKEKAELQKRKEAYKKHKNYIQQNKEDKL
ncbi:hypothetical protein GMMP1_1490006 [Candidatus Magnetomoraceae bacterium gMMP-1]